MTTNNMSSKLNNKFLQVISVEKKDIADMKDITLIQFEDYYFQKNDRIISEDESCKIRVGFRTGENQFSVFEISGELKSGDLFRLNLEKVVELN